MKTPLNNEQTQSNEGQECKTRHVKGRALMEGGKMKRVQEGEHGRGMFYTGANMEH
jgi:hypothetical protein